MTPKEKAFELITKYYGHFTVHMSIAKQCALIAIDEILKTNPYEWDGEDLNSNIDYWQEVKQEIEKL